MFSYTVQRLVTVFRTMATTDKPRFYQLSPLKLGAEVTGISLQKDPPQAVIDQIRRDVHSNCILVFRDQGILSGKRQVEISRWFGELDSTFYRHPRSPDPDVFRVSNDNSEGCTQVGRTGWHIDGSFQQAPFAYSIYHIISVPEQGDTVFVPLYELVRNLSPDTLDRWDRLWMVSDRRGDILHPLVYSHPVTDLKTLCFHLGMTEAFVWDYGQPAERWTDAQETKSILSEIYNVIVKDNASLHYSHKYKEGDLIISDNLSVGHEASVQTQWPRSRVGLRVMHRTTVRGLKPPAKNYQPTALEQQSK